MTCVRRFLSQTADWPDLAAELDRWGETGRRAALWWRDDDAVAATPQLDALLRIADGAPLALAVIPARAGAELSARLRAATSVSVLQHGWRHVNRAGGGKKSEYPPDRTAAGVAAEVAAGRARLAALFGPLAFPVFVPPWNRIAPNLLPVLAANGMAALSVMAAGSAPERAAQGPARLPAGLAAIDVHLDVTDWQGGRGFVGTAAALQALVGRLQDLRLGAGAAPGSVGILTHHLIMDDETAGFLGDLCRLIARHAAARWTGIAELLQ